MHISKIQLISHPLYGKNSTGSSSLIIAVLLLICAIGFWSYRSYTAYKLGRTYILKIAGGVKTPGQAQSVAVSGSRAYIADLNTGLQVIDISNPEKPAITGSLQTGETFQVAVAGSRATVSNGSYFQQQLQPEYDFKVVDLTIPDSPKIASVVKMADVVRGMAISGNYAYIANGNSGLKVYDISNPASPKITADLQTNGASDLSIAGNYAYVAAGNGGLLVLDITNPKKLELIGGVYIDLGARDVAISGIYACVLNWDTEFIMVDISDPRTPRIKGKLDMKQNGSNIAVCSHFACVAAGDASMIVIDITNPEKPFIAGSMDDPVNVMDVAVSGSYAYAADWKYGLKVIDISSLPGSDVSKTPVKTQ